MVEVTINGQAAPDGFFRAMGQIAALLIESGSHPSVWSEWDEARVKHGERLREQFDGHEGFREHFNKTGEMLGLFEAS